MRKQNTSNASSSDREESKKTSWKKKEFNVRQIGEIKGGKEEANFTTREVNLMSPKTILIIRKKPLRKRNCAVFQKQYTQSAD